MSPPDSRTTTLDPLLTWYRANLRPLPWRANTDPYPVWVSEIMLQQTGVCTVIPYFERWMVRFPTVQELAKADDQDVLSVWQGLGYYRRCRNLLAAARQIAAEGWPTNAAGWLKVPGVGRYTAAAIASISLGEPSPLVDGNVERVYARLIADPAEGAELKRRAWSWAQREMRAKAPGDWNQALMELGATVCTAVSPRCAACPVAGTCAALQAGTVEKLPTPTLKRAVVKLEFDVEVPVCDGRLGLRQIPPGQWWEGMWEFPRSPRGTSSFEGTKLEPIKHAVTHHRITLHPVIAYRNEAGPELTWFTPDELVTLPLPAPQRKLLGAAAAKLPQLDIRRCLPTVA